MFIYPSEPIQFNTLLGRQDTPQQPCLTAGIQEQGRRVHQDVWGCEVECKMGGCGRVLEKEDNPQGAQASLHSQALPELSCNVMDL